MTFQGFAARTETPGALESEHAFSGGGEYRTRLFRTDFNYTEVAEDFNPEVGFLERSTAYRQVSTGYHHNLRTQGLTEVGFRELRPHATYESFWDFDGFQETGTVHMDVHLDWENGNFFSPAVNRQYEGLLEPFEVYPGVVVPPGQYAGFHTAFAGNTDRRKALSLSGNWNYGAFLSGNQNVIVPALTYRSGGTFSTSFRWQRSDIDLPQGAFVDQPRHAARDVQLQHAGQCAGSGAVQRPDRPLVHERALQLAADGGHRALRRLQRHGGVQRSRSRQPRVHREVLAHVRRAPVATKKNGHESTKATKSPKP